MSDDLLRELARAKAAFQLRAIKAVIADHPSTPGLSASITSNASPDATMQAAPSGLTRRTEKPPASLAVTIISAPVDVRPDTIRSEATK